MSAVILSGKTYAQELKNQAKINLTELIRQTGVTPGLAVIIVGADPASQVYVRNKHRTCREMGINSQVISLPENTGKSALITAIKKLNEDVSVHGILLQLPLPKTLQPYESEILYNINPSKDVDGFHPVNVGKLSIGEKCMVPCTPLGCIKMLESAGIPIDGKNAVIIGRSNIVGKPMANLLLAKNATVTICHSHTQNLKDITRTADILIAAVGRPAFVTADMIKPGAAIIDVGINRIAPKKLVGDVDFTAVKEKAAFITPVPGGVGLLTIATLMQNTIEAARQQLL
ncbi:bifunctional methylenetetrahydrofolate dehydrogenase/methenyltetrahydrofolate cyclohydrolase FolD [Pectinatus frisingensis]|jgi:methylenetetrahydrofolate dehydrogenase (NADP+)/methenyltetrahydrofolate cyclohydrolase|uniref:bifunctional methylenetetrahydrofolate dehydrogenase/methenyltetrahydrofolate cyclohydrolase FolD n=1 Tax=Pectinatus frisingensis TaxID=865 RepID=UPI0015F56C31|nr:bifunctional methylenetetrahydrofolate dehydrogenase/methenyltetrahydrofolate cyclohydrolase FolD [Pectinatus frisingensis]